MAQGKKDPNPDTGARQENSDSAGYRCSFPVPGGMDGGNHRRKPFLVSLNEGKRKGEGKWSGIRC